MSYWTADHKASWANKRTNFKGSEKLDNWSQAMTCC